MPGGRGNVEAPSWFLDTFGFEESTYAETRRRFELDGYELVSKTTGDRFYVGPFETPSVDELRQRSRGSTTLGAGGLTFQNVTGDARSLHRDGENGGAVFQVASQFNCLEMNEPGVKPEAGVTRYYNDKTQGPACALSCPGATVYRNYFVNGGKGQGGGHQIDCLADIGELVCNKKEKYWRMVNGYCMPEDPSSIGRLSKLISDDTAFEEEVRSRLRVGVHWDTDVKHSKHRVCQVFSSALPVGYAKSTKSTDWAPFAKAVLAGTFEATLAVAAVLAAERGARVKVFLTAVGGGAFGNRSQWIVEGIDRALRIFSEAPLDVMLVHFGTVPRSAYSSLDTVLGKRCPQSACLSAKQQPLVANEEVQLSVAEMTSPAPVLEHSISDAERVTAAFAACDLNGDGVLETSEVVQVLQRLDHALTEQRVHKLVEAADANGDGEIHYAEFAAWIFNDDSAITSRVLKLGLRADDKEPVELRESISAAALEASPPEGLTPSTSSTDAEVPKPGAKKNAERKTRDPIEIVLAKIREAQNKASAYNRALKEIQGGKKKGHWIWFIWPTTAALRPGTSRPEFLLPNLKAVQAYLEDDVLGPRFREITITATEKLKELKGASQVLFGSKVDAEKFAETMTLFAVASAEIGDAKCLEICSQALGQCQKFQVDARAMEAIVGIYGLSTYQDVKDARKLQCIAHSNL